ncbi:MULTISPECIES: DUF6443 domain-containing protein [Dysgonomonas]|uniref:PI-PLC Y-box domain-containing protein n=1 Tax=Dysgonomonas gadei ATCC BAA-286 TaxID=742766 RepID=F5J3D3_9BACT|nr:MULTISPECIES: DUF6443 domain-containing protein [Dysgonomonas]EGJ99791.1 hypothetical protein HMPREF9455_03850 [Dysgonomonas gadei ATCC BAA-286]MBF0648119.1 RHS repeat-associated core domain-containing protein [Dysgonomonas sp. GY75]
MKIKCYLTIIIVLLLSGGIHSQSSTQNYLQTRTYTNDAGTTYLDEIQYFDGLGRPMQTVQRGITPNAADLVTYQEYDAFGRESNSWLPAVASGNNGSYMPFATYKAKAMTTYTNDSAYSRPVYEASPLNRVLEQYSPGKEWYAGKRAVKTEYQTNTAGGELSCALFRADTDASLTLTQTGNYGVGQLYVTKITDEDQNISYEFKDKLGQVILTRQIESAKQYDTYYIYDDYGNLKAVLPPLASDTVKANSAQLNNNSYMRSNLAYLYMYDNRNRCTSKKLPGCDWVRYVYDKADRLIFSQDGEQRKKLPNEWTFNKYDAFGRVIISGIHKTTESHEALIAKCQNIVVTEKPGGNFEYTWNSLPEISYTGTLSLNYYDNYYDYFNATLREKLKFVKKDGFSDRYIHPSLGEGTPKGLLIGTRIKTFKADGSLGEIASKMYYDNRGRIIQINSTNHLGGIDEEHIAYNFTGQPTKRMYIHSATGKTTQTEVYTYTYDHAGRLLTTTHQLTDGTTVKPQVTLAENTYDELGRLKTNKKGGQANLNSTYAYNIRSWTKSITSPLFTETLYYNESYGGSAKQYNGNISAMSWKHNTETNPRGYAFVYDNLSRLTKATYLINGTVQTYNASTPTKPIYQTAYSYDKHGNMKTLQRYGNIDAAKYGLIDNLTMTYAGNQMTRVDEAAAAISIAESMDFKNGSNVANEYTYNANGAMNKDLNKGITEIQYNSLNLPRQMIINSSSVKAKNYYTYSASGVKLRTEQRYDPNYTVTPSNATNPTNDGLADYKNTDYVGNIIYETVKSGSTITNKTRILVDGGYIEGGVYYYYLTDHLGNNRVVANAGGTVIQRNHYYPFGMSFADTPLAEQGKQPYKYNNKELDMMHGLNLYDYSARYYESALGRFISVDPLAEKYYSWSPYVYCGNNPLRRTDPTGMIWDDPKEAQKLKDNISKVQNSISKRVGEDLAKIFKGGLDKKSITKLAGNIQEGLDRFKNLDQAKNDIDLLGNDQNNTYALSSISGGQHKVRLGSDNKVYIETSSDGLSIHEVTHVRQSLDTGGLQFSPNGELLNAGIKSPASSRYARMSGMEVEAYQMQYSYDKSYPGKTNNGLQGIDVHSVGDIRDNGKLVYPFAKEYSNFLKKQQKLINR